MPSPAITQSLSSLLPSIPKPAPRLISLAESLLALSRQRASHLKPEEEIARAYACCEIACDRLRAQLRLPPTKKGGAPCKPVVYRKLLGYLEQALGDDGPGTPGKRKREESNGVVQAEVEIQSTPRKRIRQQTEVTPSKSGGRQDGGFVGTIKAQSAKGRGLDREAPVFVMPAIRKMCKAFRTPEMAPHVYTGTCVVLKLANLWPPQDSTEPENLEEEVTSLLAALYLLVLTRMNRGKMTKKIFVGVSNRATEMFATISETRQIEECVRRINKDGYCKGQDWWDSVPEDVFEFSTQNLEAVDVFDFEDRLEAEIEEEDGGEEIIAFARRKDFDLDHEDPDGVLLPGLGTMMADAVDWLSEDRRANFQRWHRGIVKQIGTAA